MTLAQYERIVELEEALRFYADAQNYEVNHTCSSFECKCTITEVGVDQGEYARRVLNEY